MVIAPWFTWGCCGPGKVTQRTFGTSDQCSPSWTLWFQYTSEPRKKFYSEISIHSFDFLFSKNKEQLEVKTHTHTKYLTFNLKWKWWLPGIPAWEYSAVASLAYCVWVSLGAPKGIINTQGQHHTPGCILACIFGLFPPGLPELISDSCS